MTDMMKYAAAIQNIPMPDRLARRPIGDNKMPVPWFVSYINGKWDFVNLDPRKIGEAYRRKICWLCGEPLGKYLCFPIGPMCSINRVSSEPAAHRECAEYAVRACPFLARPAAKRNEKAHLGKSEDSPGIAIEHNPGAVVIWVTRSYRPIQVDRGNLFRLGDPVETLWFTEGRGATRAEIEAAMAKGLPLLRKSAETEGPDAVTELEFFIKRAEKLLPAE